MSRHFILVIAPLVVISLMQLSCRRNKGTDRRDVSKSGSGEQTKYEDPFSYCRLVDTVDSPDPRYVGPNVPEEIAAGLMKAIGAPEGAPPDVFEGGTSWRCMDGKVYACNAGANLPCAEKADTSREPNQGMREWCESNNDAEFIPAFASGRSTVYEWRCAGNEPKIVKEANKPDAAGYLSNIWYEISPEP